MSSWYLGIDLIVTFLLASILLWNYGNWYRHHIIVTLAVLLAWYFSFIIIFVLPMDISDATYRQCLELSNLTSPTAAPTTAATHTNSSLLADTINNINTNTSTVTVDEDVAAACLKPASYVGDAVLKKLWRVVYWTCQVLTWLILPLMQSYTQAGEFRVSGKLKSALMDNAIYYGSYLFIVGILVCYIATKPKAMEWHELKVIASAASNTWGLFLLVFMLGYGLVSLPNELWLSSCKAYSLNKAYFKVSKLNAERLSCEDQVDELMEIISGCVKCDSERPRRRFQEELDAILSPVPVELRERMGRRNVEAIDHDLKYLVAIHKKLKRSLMSYNRTEALYRIQVKNTIELEDIEKCLSLGSFQSTIESPFWKRLGPRLEWVWKCLLWRWLLYFTSLTAYCFSVIVIWSEVTFFVVKPQLSIFAHFISYDYKVSETVCLLGILYLATCTFYTVFRIRVFNFYYLAGGHLTDEYSLIFAGMLLCRLTPPLCLNFLGLTHMDSHIIKTQEQETSYTYIMGHLDVLSIVSDGFNVYFPMGILLIALLTWFKIGSRLLNYVGVQQFQQFFPDDEISDEYANEGRQILVRERRRLLRNSNKQPQVVQEANRNLQILEDARINSQSRAYGSPDTTTNRYEPSVPQYNPPRGLFDDV